MDIQLISSLLDLLGIAHSRLFLEKTAKAIPFQNSFYGISLLLSHYNIVADSVRFKDRGLISDDETPCIVLYEGRFVILRHVTATGVVLLSSSGKQVVNKEEFESKWDGSALVFNATKRSKEPDYVAHRKEELTHRIKQVGGLVAVVALLSISALRIQYLSEWSWWTILAINIVGLAVAIMLLQKQLHIHNPLSDKICGLVKTGNCDSVTHSSGSELFGLFKLSEIGFAFFATNIVSLSVVPGAVPIMAIISYVVLPFSFWSVWYQRFRARQWCVLCLCVLSVMWLQAAFYFFSGIVRSYSISIMPLCIIGLLYALFYCSISILMGLLSDKKAAERWQRDFVDLKSQDKVLAAYCQDSRQFNVDSVTGSAMEFGSSDAPIEIAVFSNPYCSPCAELHKRLKDIPGDIVRVRYVLTYFSDELSRINRYIIAAFQQLGAEKTWEILDKWYHTGKDEGERFFEKYDLNIDSADVWSEFDKHAKCAKNNSLHGTPTIVINGHELTGPYTIDDFKMISDFI